MVSLKSFKLINEGERDEVEEPTNINSPSTNFSSNNNNNHHLHLQHHQQQHQDQQQQQQHINNNILDPNNKTNKMSNTQISLPVDELVAAQGAILNRTEYITYNESNTPSSDSRTLSVVTEGEHFEIVWSNLSYRIEPKWYKKINFLDQVFQTIDSHSSASSTASSSAGMNDNQHQMHATAQADAPRAKTSLDPIEIFTNLNGTIKSGQMTAVLGPSGKINFYVC